MTDFVAFTIFGIVTGSIYATAASGLVVSYTTTGIFNVAHGAMGMVMAFLYWELRFHRGWPAPVALVVVVLVVAPAAGALVERLLMRRLHGVSVATSLVVTIGLTLFLMGLAVNIWKPEARPFPGFFGPSGFSLGTVFVTWHQLTVVLLTAAVALGLRALLFGTRVGVAMRAVVDSPDLARLNGSRPATASMFSWATGSALAALAGILLAPVVSLEVFTLTLLVVNAYAAAVVGRLTSLPRTFAGAAALGLAQSYAVGYLPLRGVLSVLSTSMPTVFLFAALMLVPAQRLRGTLRVGLDHARVPTVRQAVTASGALVAVAAVLATVLGDGDVIRLSDALALGIVMLSLVLLAGYSGQVSLCQMSFAGLGAYATVHVGGGGSILGLVVAVALSAAVGALVALPAIRLEGLYLALSTMAFALLMEKAFFNQKWAFGTGGAATVERLSLGPFGFGSPRTYLVFLAAAFAGTGLLVLGVRRGWFGRRLAAMKDSPAACTTLGLDLTATKLAVFSLSAGLAGLGGALLGGVRERVGTDDFAMFQSLQVLLLAVIGGVTTVGGALVGGLLDASYSFLTEYLPSVGALPFFLTGLAGIVLGASPAGLWPRLADSGRRWWEATSGAAPAGRTTPPAPPSAPAKARPPAVAARVPAPSANGAAAAPTPVVRLEGVRAGYGKIEVLHGIDLEVPKGSVVALLGPNGAGKTTTLGVIAGRVLPTAGSVRVTGRRVDGSPPESLARAGVCTIPEVRGVFPNLTVDDNLRMVSHLMPLEAVRDRSYGRFPQLAARRQQLAGTLSGGEQQMLAMARAVATEPGLLLLDEISMGLAPRIVAELYGLVAQLTEEGTTVLLVEQFVQAALGVADAAVVLVNGSVFHQGRPDEVGEVLAAGYLGAAS